MSELYHAAQLPLFGQTKVCTSCQNEKPLEEFYKQSPARGGYQAWCKVCWNERRRLKRLKRLENDSLYGRPISKVCTKCGIEKSVSEFYADNAADSGYKPACKICCDRAYGIKDIGKRRVRRTIPVAPGYKLCTGCNAEKPISEFIKKKGMPDGHNPQCNDCRLSKCRVHWYKVREQVLPQWREQWQTISPEERERHNARNRKNDKTPRARLRNAEKARRRKVAYTYSKVDYRAILDRDGYHCYICGKDIDPALQWQHPASLSFDHEKPLHGKDECKGEHTESNIHPAHRICNIRKGTIPLNEMTPHQRRGPDA